MSKLRLAALAVVLFSLASCVSLKAPEEINVNTQPRPGSRRVNTTNAPPPSSPQEAQARLDQAYNRIDYLEHENAKLREKNAKLESECDKYKDRYEDLKDKYDD